MFNCNNITYSAMHSSSATAVTHKPHTCTRVNIEQPITSFHTTCVGPNSKDRYFTPMKQLQYVRVHRTLVMSANSLKNPRGET